MFKYVLTFALRDHGLVEKIRTSCERQARGLIIILGKALGHSMACSGYPLYNGFMLVHLMLIMVESTNGFIDLSWPMQVCYLAH